MKKIICICLILSVILCGFVACKKAPSSDEKNGGEDVNVIGFDTTTSQPEETTKLREQTTNIDLDEKMEINIPLSIIDQEYQNNLSSYAATYGFDDIEKEADGTVTISMKGIDYSLLLSRIGMKVMIELGSIVDSGDYPYLVKLDDYTNDFSYLLMLVKGDEYKKATDTNELSELIGQCGLYYQLYTTNETKKCEVVFADSETGKVLSSEVYTK